MKRSIPKLSLKSELLEILGIFLIGATANFLFWCYGCLDSLRVFLVNIVVSGSFWVFLWKGSQYMVMFLDSFLSWTEQPLKRFVLSLGSVVVYTTIVVYFLDTVIDVFIYGKSFALAIQKLNYASLTYSILITVGINTFMHGRAFLLEWRQAAIDNEKLKTEQVSSQYNSLKNQVNPHFLFYSLNVLSSLVYEDQDKAVEFIRKLSQVYRYVLESKDEEVVPIDREVEFSKNFIFLQKIRFGENLRSNISGDLPKRFVPPLAIQILVENAIKHNVVSEKDPLTIDIKITEDHCTISNSLKEKKVKDSTGIGLANIKARYKYLTDAEVRIEKTEDRFSVSIPLLKVKQ